MLSGQRAYGEGVLRLTTFNVLHGMPILGGMPQPQRDDAGRIIGAPRHTDDAQLREAVAQLGSDVLALQEVDRHQDRSGLHDQTALAAEALGAEFHRCVDMIVSRLNATPLVLQIPIGAEGDFRGVVDLVTMKAITYKDETMGADYIVSEIPASMVDEANTYREKLIEKVSEHDDKLLEKYLGGETITEDEIPAAPSA